jgi:hypothetical protein
MGNLIHVEFDWDDKYGECFECGSPAAYTIGIDKTWYRHEPWEMCEKIMIEKYGSHCQDPGAHMKPIPKPEDLRCAVCAAMAASEGGETITWLWKDDFSNGEHAF